VEGAAVAEEVAEAVVAAAVSYVALWFDDD